jgi:hypothetical protein
MALPFLTRHRALSCHSFVLVLATAPFRFTSLSPMAHVPDSRSCLFGQMSHTHFDIMSPLKKQDVSILVSSLLRSKVGWGAFLVHITQFPRVFLMNEQGSTLAW